MEEEWRSCPTWPGYWVSSLGRVRSKYRVRKLQTDKDGHKKAYLSIGGRHFNVSVHRMVCEAFNGPPPSGALCRHLNGIPDDNRPENLAWGTVRENSADAIKHGVQVSGDRHHAKKLTADQACDIYRRAHNGPRGTGRALASEYGISVQHVTRIKRRHKRARDTARV